MPARVRNYVTAVLVVAAGMVGMALVNVGDRPAWWRIALTFGVFFLGEHALFEIRTGHDHRSFTWAETACVVALAAVAAPWALLLGPAAVAAAHLVRRRPLLKVAFNAGSCAIGLMT